ncbi:protein kinase domain-containing protein [Candidatus Uabimicrobium amorphum]|uniref:Protein kinase n=1 Tax=Uabimicrobium amorphum TaxID=2596890 RepID=A0A5S9IJE7_UABAM|nr:protein kinase [Candidatus Uabimicrobium amorphum]BBM82979.1 protein kinase [Candidatus Uabimicrobium amorphum]
MDFDSFFEKYYGEKIDSVVMEDCKKRQVYLRQQNRHISLVNILLKMNVVSEQQIQIIQEKYQSYVERMQKQPTNQSLISDISNKVRGKSSLGLNFGNYKIIQELGRGGMGAVYRVHDPKLNREVALKVMLTQDEQHLLRFTQEAQTIARLDHPNIIRIFEVGDKPQHYFTMEYICGISLHKYIVDHDLDEKKIATMFLKVAQALSVAHRQKIIHRDLKPENIMLTQKNEPKVMDFGLAKIKHNTASLSKNFVGTPAYASPEQIQEGQIDSRTDIYSLGATLYEALTKRRVFQGQNTVNIMYQAINKDPIAPRVLNPEISVDLEAICLKCLQKSPKKRYFNMEKLAQDLQNFLDNRPISAKPPSALQKVNKFVQRNLLLTTIVGIAALIISSLFVYFSIKLATKQGELQRQEAMLDVQREVLQTKETSLQREKKRSREGFYPYVIALSDVYIQKNNIAIANKLINSEEYCPEYLRGWEWYWIASQVKNEVLNVHHGMSLKHFAFTPSKKHLFTFTRKKIIQWNPTTLKSIKTIKTEADYGVIDKKEEFVLTAKKSKLSLWSIRSGSKIRDKQLEKEIYYLDINYRNNIVAVAMIERIQFLSFPQLEFLYEIEEKSQSTDRLDFHPSKNVVAYTGKYGYIHRFDFDRKKRLPKLHHPGYLRTCKYNENGNWLVSAGDGPEIRLWNTKQHKLIKKYEYSSWVGPHKKILHLGHSGIIRDCSFSSDDRFLISAGDDKTLKLWDIRTGEMLQTFRGHISPVLVCDFTRDDRYVLSTGNDGRLKKWDTQKFLPHYKKIPASIHNLDVFGNLLMYVAEDRFIYVRDIFSGELLFRKPCINRPRFGKFITQKGKQKFVIGDKKGNISVYDFKSRRLEKKIYIREEILDMKIDSQHQKLLALGRDRRTILYRLDDFSVLHDFPGKKFACATFSHDGKWLFAAYKKACYVFSTTTFEYSKIEIPVGRSISRLTTNYDDSILAVGMTNYYIYLFDLRTRKQLTILNGHDGSILDIAFNRAGDRIVSASEDCTIRMWNTTGDQLIVLNAHTGYVTACKFFNEDDSLVSSGMDGRIVFWENNRR